MTEQQKSKSEIAFQLLGRNAEPHSFATFQISLTQHHAEMEVVEAPGTSGWGPVLSTSVSTM